MTRSGLAWVALSSTIEIVFFSLATLITFGAASWFVFPLFAGVLAAVRLLYRSARALLGRATSRIPYVWLTLLYGGLWVLS